MKKILFLILIYVAAASYAAESAPQGGATTGSLAANGNNGIKGDL